MQDQIGLGESLEIPFYLYDADGVAAVDTDESHYTFPVLKDGSAVSSPVFTITNPTGSLLLLTYTPAAIGSYTYGELAHATSGYATDILGGGTIVRSSTVDDLVGALAIPAVAIAAETNPAAGSSLYLTIGTDWTVTLRVLAADGSARDISAWTSFTLRFGDREDSTDTAWHEEAASIVSGPDGTVTAEVSKADTETAPFTSRTPGSAWYYLEGVDASSKTHALAIGRLTLVLNIPEAP